ncbi:MAG: response regulator [Alphaproteobacteria bacterium]|nr:response regulator [Alphaproteobacteria bacterium]
MAVKLLVVDDDPVTGDLLAQCGRIARVETRAVADPRSFWALLDSFQPTAVIVDIVMPEEDGITMLRHLASIRLRIPVVLISAYSHTYLPAARRLGEAYGLPIVAALPKPITPSAFEDLVRRIEAFAG